MEVVLRPWQRDDRYMLAELANNIKIWNNVRDRLPHPYQLAHATAFIKYCRKQHPPHILAVESDKKLAGCIGIEMQEDVSRIAAELGYWIGEPCWGRGIATVAVQQMMDYVFDAFPHLIRIYARVFEFNTASMRVLEKNGFHLESVQQKSAVKNERIVDEHVWVKFR